MKLQILYKVKYGNGSLLLYEPDDTDTNTCSLYYDKFMDVLRNFRRLRVNYVAQQPGLLTMSYAP